MLEAWTPIAGAPATAQALAVTLLSRLEAEWLSTCACMMRMVPALVTRAALLLAARTIPLHRAVRVPMPAQVSSPLLPDGPALTAMPLRAVTSAVSYMYRVAMPLTLLPSCALHLDVAST